MPQYTLIDATTIDRVKYALKIPTSQLTDDTFLSNTVTSVSDLIQTYLDRPFLQQTVTEEFDYEPNQANIYLAYPVQSIQSVRFSETGEFSSGATITGYRVNLSTGVLRLTSAIEEGEFAFGFRREWPLSVQVIYSCGIATSTVDLISKAPGLAGLADAWVVDWVRHRDNPSATAKKLGDNSITYEAALQMPKFVREGLFPLRRWRAVA